MPPPITHVGTSSVPTEPANLKKNGSILRRGFDGGGGSGGGGGGTDGGGGDDGGESSAIPRKGPPVEGSTAGPSCAAGTVLSGTRGVKLAFMSTDCSAFNRGSSRGASLCCPSLSSGDLPRVSCRAVPAVRACGKCGGSITSGWERQVVALVGATHTEPCASSESGGSGGNEPTAILAPLGGGCRQ